MATITDGSTELKASELNKLLTGSASNQRLAHTVLTPDASSPSASTGYGFSATVTRNDTGDYTLSFETTFSAAPMVLSATPVDTTDYEVLTQSVTATQIRVIVKVRGGAASDGCAAVHIVVLGW